MSAHQDAQRIADLEGGFLVLARKLDELQAVANAQGRLLQAACWLLANGQNAPADPLLVHDLLRSAAIGNAPATKLDEPTTCSVTQLEFALGRIEREIATHRL